MPVDRNKVLEAVRQGWAIPCATCIHFHRARDRGSWDCGVEGCQGPIGGGDFAGYEGEIPDLGMFCFACGAEPRYGLAVAGRDRVIGVCAEHLRYLSELIPSDPSGALVLARDGATLIRVERLLEKPEPRLLQAIVQQQAEWDAEDKARGEAAAEDQAGA